MNEKQIEKLTGTIKSVSYHDEETGFSVLYVERDSDGEELCVVGTFPIFYPGEEVTFTGNYSVHPIYGDQFKASFAEGSLPREETSILNFLASGGVKGIGEKYAKKVVKLFGRESLDIIENNPEELSKIPGITYSKAVSISEEFHKRINLRNVVTFLSSFNIQPSCAISAYKKYGQEVYSLIRDNPYILCENEIGVPFNIVDNIAESLGIEQEDDCRVNGGVLFILSHNMNNGHTCIPKDILITKTSEYLGVSLEKVATSITDLSENAKIVCDIVNDREFVYLSENFACEEYIANKIAMMLSLPVPQNEISEIDIKRIEEKNKILYDDIQINAIKLAIKNSVMILTGGPGTGKTTTLYAIIEILKSRNLSVALTAPTGRAAKRMAEVSKTNAQTIHRLLEVDGVYPDNSVRFKHSSKLPLPFDAVIVDEMSMVDAKLFYALISALKTGCRLILVGDPNQLPSVGAGNVLKDLIDSNKIPLCHLNKIFRQAQESMIIKCAHDIINGKKPDFSINEKDVFFVKACSNEETAMITSQIVEKRLPQKYNCNPLTDVQVITPTRQGLTGTTELNKLLQSSLNYMDNEKPEFKFGNVTFRLGDKVMQTKNNYDITYETLDGKEGTGIFNGDIGTIISVASKLKTLKVKFDDKIVIYSGEMLLELEHAYALTIHKSQGSEFDYVVIPIFDVNPKLAYRKLIYTAITRAKKMLILVGKIEAFNQMVSNDKHKNRYTNLKYRICDLMNNE